MHILVVDDFVLVELALAQVIQDTSHTLIGVRDPRSLLELLDQAARFDLALADINFGPGVPTGLTAMRILHDLSPEPRSWRALVRCDMRSEVARAAHVDERTVVRGRPRVAA